MSPFSCSNCCYNIATLYREMVTFFDVIAFSPDGFMLSYYKCCKAGYISAPTLRKTLSGLSADPKLY